MASINILRGLLRYKDACLKTKQSKHKAHKKEALWLQKEG